MKPKHKPMSKSRVVYVCRQCGDHYDKIEDAEKCASSLTERFKKGDIVQYYTVAYLIEDIHVSDSGKKRLHLDRLSAWDRLRGKSYNRSRRRIVVSDLTCNDDSYEAFTAKEVTDYMQKLETETKLRLAAGRKLLKQLGEKGVANGSKN